MIFFVMFLVFFFLHLKINKRSFWRSCQWFDEHFIFFFIWVVVIQFYSKSCNSISVLSLFSEKSCKSTKQDITWMIEDMKIEDKWFLEGLCRQYKLKKIHFKFQGISRRKNARKKGRKLKKSHKRYWLMRPCVWTICSCAWGSLGYWLMRPFVCTHAPAHGLRHKLMFACFSSWIGEKSPVFFS